MFQIFDTAAFLEGWVEGGGGGVFVTTDEI